MFQNLVFSLANNKKNITKFSKKVEFLKSLGQNDPELVRYVREHVLIAPELASRDSAGLSETPTSAPIDVVLEILNHKVNNFLIFGKFFNLIRVLTQA